MINAYLLSKEGYPVTVFEAFHELGGVLRYGIPEFRLPNALIDDVVRKIEQMGGKFVKNFLVGKIGPCFAHGSVHHRMIRAFPGLL